MENVLLSRVMKTARSDCSIARSQTHHVPGKISSVLGTRNAVMMVAGGMNANLLLVCHRFPS